MTIYQDIIIIGAPIAMAFIFIFVFVKLSNILSVDDKKRYKK